MAREPRLNSRQLPRNLGHRRTPHPNSKNRSNLAPGAAIARRRQRRQRTQHSQRRHCYTLVAIQLWGNSCDKRTDLHQKLAESRAFPARRARVKLILHVCHRNARRLCIQSKADLWSSVQRLTASV